MADDIRIRVGVQSNVKAGMDGVVRDVEAGGRSSSKRFDAAMTGRGFKETILKIFRGDISGAIDDLAHKFDNKMSAAAVKVGGVLTAAFTGFQAGQLLDRSFGLSDKIGGAFAKRFGESEDQGLKGFDKFREAYRSQLDKLGKEEESTGESSDAKKARENVENLTDALAQLREVASGVTGKAAGVAEKMMSELESRLKRAESLKEKIDRLESAIKPLEADNRALEQRGQEREAAALQATLKRQGIEEAVKAAGFEPGAIGRMVGQGARDMQAQADYLTRTALDDNFRRSEQQQSRQVARTQRRNDRLVALAEQSRVRFKGFEGNTTGVTPEEEAKWRKMNPRLARVLDAAKSQEAAKRNKENLEQLQRDAAQATIDAAKDTMKIRDNTAAIKELRDELKLGA